MTRVGNSHAYDTHTAHTLCQVPLQYIVHCAQYRVKVKVITCITVCEICEVGKSSDVTTIKFCSSTVGHH